MNKHFLGYERADGSVGIRNHVVVLSAMDNCNGVVDNIASLVDGVISIPIWYGRGQYGEDEKLTHKTLVGLGSNPNVHSVLVVSLEPVSAEKLANGIREQSEKDVRSINVQECGNSIQAVAEGVRIAAEMVSEASEQQTKKFDISHLVLGVECGGTDTTSGITSNPSIGFIADDLIDNNGSVILTETSEFLGAEQVLGRRAKNKDVEESIYSIVNNVELQAQQRGVSILGANPVPDNIAGGITTIEEKSLGAIIKGGSKEIQSVIPFAEVPNGKGLHIMDTPAPACESMTGIAAGGAQVILFSTGKGNIIGNPIVPTIKVSANPETVQTMKPNIDFDLSSHFIGEETLEDVSIKLKEYFLKVSSGKKTKSEILGMEEIALNKIQPTV